jgi:hypothetical protein
MQVDILKGVYNKDADYGEKYPKNIMPIAQQTNVSTGYLKNVNGVVQFTDSTDWGLDRGGINWNGRLFRALGQFLVEIDSTGNIFKRGEIGNDFKNVSFAYGFDRLAIVSNGKLFYYVTAGGVFSEVTDPDLGLVQNVLWVDGYFVLNDSQYIIVTELNDPTSIDPFKYGSSEISPDDIISILKLKNEIVALNRYSIEFFSNIGSSGFPFQRIEGATITRGCIGRDACCVYDDTITFLGNAVNEQLGIYQAVNGQSVKISTKEIDNVIASYSETQLTVTKLEMLLQDGDLMLYVHFLNGTWVYNITASKALQTQVWYSISSFINNDLDYYDAWNYVYCFDKLICGRRSSTTIGYVDASITTHWGNKINWEFQTNIIYNEGNGAIIHEMELQHNIKALPLTQDAYISTDYSFDDGVTWSQRRNLSIGRNGNRVQKMRFVRNGRIETRRVQRFSGDSDSNMSISRLDMRIEPLAW